MIYFLFVLCFITCASSQNKPLSEYVNRFTLLTGSAILENNKNENVVFAPLNIFHAFGLLHLGSVNETRKELSDIFGFPEISEKDFEHHTKFGNLLRSLQNSENITLLPSAGIFVQNDFVLNATYVEKGKSIYDAEMKNLDFTDAATTKYVNKWIAEKTKEHIPEFFKEPINPDTKVQLLSALYFAADWNTGFDKSMTRKEDFRTAFSTTKVDMMTKKLSATYLDDPKYPFRVLGLPYKNEDFYFYIQLPRDEPTSASYKNNFDSVYLTSVEGLESLSHVTVLVKFPRLSISSTSKIGPILEKLGGSRIVRSPQLSGMFKDLVEKIEVSHSATVEIDESGTVATAVTSILVPVRSLPEPPLLQFFVDKPFTFFIYNKPLKTILFAGVVSHI